MPFFLLSRDDNDDLRLLTSTASPNRQDALAALSRLTADSGFDAWDADVLLVDLDSATQVLLVRPADAAPAAEPELVAAEAVIPAEEAEAFSSYVSIAAEDDDIATAAVSIDEVSLADEFFPVPDMAMELEPEPEPASAPAEPESEPVDADGDDLREALSRTTMAMAEETLSGESGEPSQPQTSQADPVTEKWPWDIESPPAVEAVAEPLEAAASGDDSGIDSSAMGVPVAEIPDISQAADEPAVETAEVSEFLQDLEPISLSIEPAPADSEVEFPPATDPEVELVTVDEYVCADCVYVGTCPNKDERLPRDCGSFQWK